jgi:asparagine synthase (glutamine-hydrolysing)
MCGIAGICAPVTSLANRDRLQRMADSLRHRGPDGEGFYIHDTARAHIGFAHRRLAITDPSPLHAQPFRYLNRYVVVHNGEIYNHASLRTLLVQKGYHFDTLGDTEVIAAAYAANGPACVEQFDGMFAFAVWDEEEGTLFCARDRFGEKPFHYHWDPHTDSFYFGSEMKAIWAAGIPRVIQPAMFLHYLTLGLTAHPALPELSFYREVFRLPPAHTLQFKPGQGGPEITRYWDLDKQSTEQPDTRVAIMEFRRQLENGLSLRLPQDHRAAALLSGGLDSSALLAAARSAATKLVPVRGFHASFPGSAKDESPYAETVAKHFKIEIDRVILDGNELAEGLPALSACQEEPFSSASVWAQHEVYAAARAGGFRVVIDGQGADEYLAGYPRYLPWFLREARGQLPRSGVNAMADALRANGFDPGWDWRARMSTGFPGLTTAWLERRARREHAAFPWIDKRFREAHEGAGFIQKPEVRTLNDILYHDTLLGPLQELLRYADRNAMAHGLEARMPYLYHPLVEYVFSLPADLKIREGWTKWILREAYRSSIPESIVHRKGKTGFEPPQRVWMDNPRVRELIVAARRKLVDAGILDARVLRAPIAPTAAYVRRPYDWRILVAAHFV